MMVLMCLLSMELYYEVAVDDGVIDDGVIDDIIMFGGSWCC